MTEDSDQMNFSADVSRLLNIVANALYTNHEVFLRELISNSADACDRLRYEAIQKPELTADESQFRIHIFKNTDTRTLTVVDNGIGMGKAELIDNLGTIAKSGTREFYERIGFNDRQIEIVATAIPKREYYVASPEGRRLFDMSLGPVALAFVGASGKDNLKRIDQLSEAHGEEWPAAWLEERGVDDAKRILTHS